MKLVGGVELIRTAASRFEQLDEVARWILEQNLFAAVPLDQVVSELASRIAKAADLGRQVGENQLKPIPSAGSRSRAVGHGRACATSAGFVQVESQRTPGQGGKPRRRPHFDHEPQLSGVEGNRRIHAGHEVTHRGAGVDPTAAAPRGSAASLVRSPFQRATPRRLRRDARTHGAQLPRGSDPGLRQRTAPQPRWPHRSTPVCDRVQ